MSDKMDSLMSKKMNRRKGTDAYLNSRGKQVAKGQRVEGTPPEQVDPQDTNTQVDPQDTNTNETASERKRGRPKSSSKSTTLTLVIDPSLKRRLKTYCASHDMTSADLLDMLIREFLDTEYN